VEKLIITACLTGAEVTREQQPNLPLTPDEIAEAAYECFLAGASMVHVHARDEQGNPTQDYEVYKKIKEKISAKCNIIFQPSTGGATYHSPKQRMQPIELCPEMATLSMGTCNFADDVFMNTEENIKIFANRMNELGVKPELECFEKGMIDTSIRLARAGLIKQPMHFDFVLGVPGAMSGELRDLLYMVESIPSGSTWTAAGVGKYQLPVNLASIMLGGHVRTGFEDNIYYKRGELAKSNAQLVERIARMSREMGREVASTDEARVILGIKS
jgi:3-keto-5-aminohexanoate cleavage enzyme